MKVDDGINLDCNFAYENLCKWKNDAFRSTNDWSFNKQSLQGITETQQYFSKLDVNFNTGPQQGDFNKCNIFC